MRTPRIGLAHELQHSFDVDKKVATYERTKTVFINGYTRYQYREPNKKVIGEPKRTMYGTQKYRKNYWSRMLILIVIIIGGISLYLYIKYDYSEKLR